MLVMCSNTEKRSWTALNWSRTTCEQVGTSVYFLSFRFMCSSFTASVVNSFWSFEKATLIWPYPFSGQFLCHYLLPEHVTSKYFLRTKPRCFCSHFRITDFQNILLSVVCSSTAGYGWSQHLWRVDCVIFFFVVLSVSGFFFLITLYRKNYFNFPQLPPGPASIEFEIRGQS